MCVAVVEEQRGCRKKKIVKKINGELNILNDKANILTNGNKLVEGGIVTW